MESAKLVKPDISFTNSSVSPTLSGVLNTTERLVLNARGGIRCSIKSATT